MKNQALFFFLKDKSKKLKCCLLQFLFGTLRVKRKTLLMKEQILSFKNGPLLRRDTGRKMAELLPLKVYPVT